MALCKGMNPTMTSMGQMTSKQPLIIIIWMHQEMMTWMNRKSIGFLDGLRTILAEVGQVDPIFPDISATNRIQHDLHESDDIQTTIDYSSGCIKR
jgi:hypothetical protein